jgi:hypothetical protein
MNTEVRLTFNRKFAFADGHSYGDSGPYERWVGTASYALDPNDPTNANIVDLEYAPRNAKGLVEFSADVDLLKPVDLAKGNRRILYDVNNRGNKTALPSFNDAPRLPDPTTLADGGNGYLMRMGYTVVISGWQGDLIPDPTLVVTELPEALKEGKPIQGTIRQEFIANDQGVLSMPLSGHRVIRSYEPTDEASATLTVRELERDERKPVARDEWSFSTVSADPTGSLKVTPSSTHLYMKNGFKPGYIYELIYQTQGSKVMGLGMVGIRDLLSFLRYDDVDTDGTPNPLAGAIDKTYTYGQSLSSRTVRQFVYDGYNADPSGRKVFDAVYPHVSGGGRLFMNSRFSQVGRYPRQHEEHQWPSEWYPFAYSAVPDPFTEDLDSVLKRPDTDPLVMHTHTNTEYWQRHASLGHTDPRSGDDLEFPENVRMYVIASAQHGGAGLTEGDFTQQLPNLMATGPTLRAVLSLMDRWATDGTPPPASRVPRRAENTLAVPEEVLANYPNIPGFNLPPSPSRLPKYNYGPDFDKGFITEHPPTPVAGQEYQVQLPVVDEDGNDIAGVRTPDIQVPVGTHTGWSLRKEGVAKGDFFSLTGSFVPFARTKKEREATKDPRLSIEERYSSHDNYVNAIADATKKLVTDDLLIQEDADRYIAAAKKRNPLDPEVPLLPLALANS